jgi:uncharacterized protein YcfL
MRKLSLFLLVAVSMLVGCAEQQPTQYQPQQADVNPEWISPILGSDPDAYQRPQRPCRGPNCPK